jgi:hypothetical protein
LGRVEAEVVVVVAGSRSMATDPREVALGELSAGTAEIRTEGIDSSSSRITDCPDARSIRATRRARAAK